MLSDALTSDTLLLSRVTKDLEPTECNHLHSDDAQDKVADYVRQSLSENTRRAYLSDLEHFEAWGGSIPTTAAQLAV